jgi:dTDP-4-amino-4,6-dideoxygalactose transaminase
MIPFNKPFLTGNELKYIEQAVQTGKISGNGSFTKQCQTFFELRYSIQKALMTTSCTDALEMSAMLANVGPGDEIIVPSYTFVSTALAFVRNGATIVFADSSDDNPNIDATTIEALITPRTKAIVVVHYAGVACDMDAIVDIAKRYSLFVIEDAAQAIDSHYLGTKRANSELGDRALGSIGQLSSFSFHETKNIMAGEGGLLGVNAPDLCNRAEIIWEKGTNRAEFFRGEVNKYGWKDIGSSFLPSELISAFLFAQLENIEIIQRKRIALWHRYNDYLSSVASKIGISVPNIPDYATINGHMYYIVTESLAQRNEIISRLKENNVHAVFHYLSLHKSEYYHKQYHGQELTNSDRYSDCLLRLPLYYDLQLEEVEKIVTLVHGK